MITQPVNSRPFSKIALSVCLESFPRRVVILMIIVIYPLQVGVEAADLYIKIISSANQARRYPEKIKYQSATIAFRSERADWSHVLQALSFSFWMTASRSSIAAVYDDLRPEIDLTIEFAKKANPSS